MVGANRSDKYVVFSVVVVITDGATHTVHLHRQARFPGAIREGAVSVVVVKRGIRLRRAVPRPIHRVDEENILPPIIVVIENTHAAAGRFGKVFLAKRTAMVAKGNTRRSGHIDK